MKEQEKALWGSTLDILQANMLIIQKNYDGCLANNMLDDLITEGGRFNKKYVELCNECCVLTVSYILGYVTDEMRKETLAITNDMLACSLALVKSASEACVEYIQKGDMQAVEKIAAECKSLMTEKKFYREPQKKGNC